jgi:hypothetical protein
LKALLAKRDGTNLLALDEDEKMFWVSLLTRGRWVLKMQAARKLASLWQEISGIGRCCPSSTLRPAILSVVPN